ncbi:YtzI protein [Metabacillus sp. 84]|uniref:YtzI protein n=1 Tax=unclassified Metabacillus TaxID=2675274 RepID=UPI003CF22198
MYWWILAICIAIVLIVLALSVITTNKAYKFKHTVDRLEEDPCTKSKHQNPDE